MGRYVSTDERQSNKYSLEIGNHELESTFSEVRDEQWLIRVWEEARRETDQIVEKADKLNNPLMSGYVLVLDEIQKIPQWSSTVKGLWDADRAVDRPLHVVVLGSAPLLMQQGLTESLAGRFELIRVNHWSFDEIEEAFGFDLSSYVYFGGYPGAAKHIGGCPRIECLLRKSHFGPFFSSFSLNMSNYSPQMTNKMASKWLPLATASILGHSSLAVVIQARYCRIPRWLVNCRMQEIGLHVGQYWMQIWGVSGALLGAN